MPRKASPYVRVTSLLNFIDSEWYKFWLSGMADKGIADPYREADRYGHETAQFGDGVHKIVEAYLRRENFTAIYSSRQLECAGHIIQWLKETKAIPMVIEGKLALEFEVKDDELGLIGHLDALLDIGGVPWIVDFKTTSKMRKTFPLQKAAYCKLLEKQYKIKVNDGVTLRVDRDPTVEKQFEISEYHNLLEYYWPIFFNILDIYNYFRGKGKYAKQKKVSSVHEKV